MNVLIFTGQFGMGHVCAAQAIREELLLKAPYASVTIVDIVEECFPHMKQMIYGCFDFTVNYCAGIYNLLNRMAGKFQCTPMKHAMVEKMSALLEQTKADYLVSTLPLSSQYLSAYKKVTGSRIPLYTYVTDICVHNEWIATETDCYFVGDISTCAQLVDAGVPKEKIVVSGIPVRQGFQPCSYRSTKKELLVMGGGLGLLPHADSLLKNLSNIPWLHVTVITGKNETLYHELSTAYPDFTVVGFTAHVAEYMARADLLLTKAGGITTFEALHSGTPLCLLRPFLVQEADNAEFVERNHFGIVLRNRGEEAQDILSLLQNETELNRMKQYMCSAVHHLETVTAYDKYKIWSRPAC